MPLSRYDRLFLFLLVLANMVLKLAWLDVNELAHDEPFTVYWSQQSFEAFSTMLWTENNPPLFFLLVKAWSAIVPFEVAWLRLPSAIFSALTVWPLFLLAHRLSGVRVAVTASLLFTLSNYHYGFAHEVRAYALFTLLATTGMWFLFCAKDQPNNRFRVMLGLAVLNTAMVYTHFFGWLAMGVQFLCILTLPELRSMRRHFLIGVGATLAFFSPYLVIFAQRAGTSISDGTWLEPPVFEELYNMVWRWSNAPVLAVTFLLLIAWSCYRDRLRSLALRLGLLWSLLPLVGMFAVSYVVPMFLDRYLVYAAPGFALLVAASVNALRWQPINAKILSGVLVGAMMFTFTPWKDNGRHPSRVVAQEHAWCGGNCSMEVLPHWYWLTYLAAKDIRTLRTPYPDHPAYWTQGQQPAPDPMKPDPASDQHIVIGAGAYLTEKDRDWYRVLRAEYGIVDSVEADHKVWVYRFRHIPQ